MVAWTVVVKAVWLVEKLAVQMVVLLVDETDVSLVVLKVDLKVV